jgi:hypothetical protein
MIVIPRPQLSGTFHVRAYQGKRLVRQVSFSNLITDYGINAMGNVLGLTGSGLGLFYRCAVGTGNATPAVSDTALVAYLADAITDGASYEAPSAPDYLVAKSFYEYTFPAGTFAQSTNLQEIGIGNQQGGTGLFSRQLFTDGQGTPTPFTVLPTETLIITYELANYLPSADITGSIDISGTLTNYTLRRAYAGGANWAYRGISVVVGTSTTGTIASILGFYGPIEAITTGPQGQNVAASSRTENAYQSGTLNASTQAVWGTSALNANPIQSVLFSTPIGQYQLGFSPGVVKTDVDEFRATLGISWARHT